MNLSMIRGDSRSFAFALTDGAGAPLDLTGASVTMTAKTLYTDSDAAAVFQKTLDDGITATDEVTGLILVALEPADTSDVAGSRTRLVYDVQVQDADDVVTTVVRGKLTVHPDVTTTIAEAS